MIGQVASLIARKGADVLLEAFARLVQRRPATHLVLVGGGADERELRALAERLRISDRVTFTGPADGADAFYQHVFDIHVLASRGEGLPLAALEAAACGLPQVGANVAGIPEIVLDGRTGLLFAPEDVEALAERLDWLARLARAAPRARTGGAPAGSGSLLAGCLRARDRGRAGVDDRDVAARRCRSDGRQRASR